MADGCDLYMQATKFLETDECREEVINMMAEARKKGVTGVPFTIVDGRWAVIGGQTADVYIQVCRGSVPYPLAALKPSARLQIFKKLAQTEKVTPLSPVPDAPMCSV